MYVLISYKSLIFFILRTVERDMIKICLHVQYPLFLSDFNETLVFSTVFRKIIILNFMKICPIGTGLFHADRQEANSRFSQLCECAKNPMASLHSHSNTGYAKTPQCYVVLHYFPFSEVTVGCLKPLNEN
jgi:hypothetical protein